MRRLLHLATAVISLPLAFLLASLIGALLPGAHADLATGNDVRIGLARGPLHYDILLPLSDDLRARFGFAKAAGVPITHPAAEWLVVGWGAEGFYSTVGDYGDMTAAVLWRALAGDAAVMHLDAAGAVRPMPGLTFLALSDAQYAALLDSIDASFLRDQSGAAVALPLPGLDGHDAFFAGRGRFTLFNTCNVWIGRTLRDAGVAFGAWTPTPQAVALALSWHGT